MRQNCQTLCEKKNKNFSKISRIIKKENLYLTPVQNVVSLASSEKVNKSNIESFTV